MPFDTQPQENARRPLDRVLELPWLVDEVVRRNLGDDAPTAHLPRASDPGARATLFRIDAPDGPLLLKVENASAWDESRAGPERELASKPSLSNELELLSSLSGSWLPRVRFFDEEEGFQFLALEWLRPFAEVARELDPTTLLRAWQDLRAAIRDLRQQGVAHPDLRERNLRFRDDRIVIADFAEARRLDRDVASEASGDAWGADTLGDVFRSHIRAGLPALLERCGGDESRDDRRVALSCRLARGLARDLGPIRHLDIGSGQGRLCTAIASEPGVARSLGVEASPDVVDAARARAFLERSPAEFDVRVCGRDALADLADSNFVTLSAAYHDIERKDAFLTDLARIAPEVFLAEMAGEAHLYPERGGLGAELSHIQRTLALPHRSTIGRSDDGSRPILVLSRTPLSRRLRAECRRTSLRPTAEARRLLRRARRSLPRLPRRRRTPDLRAATTRSIAWLQRQALSSGGLPVSDQQRVAYPEVTGYAIPTLLEWGQHPLALRLADWLAKTQNVDGSWNAPASEAPYSFDTGQILKGLLAAHSRAPALEEPIRRGCEWLVSQIGDDGCVATPDASFWRLPGGRSVPDSIHLYALEPLLRAGERFAEQRFVEAARHAQAHYTARDDLMAFDTLSHFHAYVIEALVDLGEHALARRGLADVWRRQRRDGALAAYPDRRWICLPAVAQYAVAAYKLADAGPADRAHDFLCRAQSATGGLRGSVGRGANYFQGEEITWAAKFFLDATAWRIRRSFDREAGRFPVAIASDDGRLRAVLDAVPRRGGARVLDAGCGKGRFARELLRHVPQARLTGVDLSDEILAATPAEMQTRRGSLLDLPFDADSFDHAYTVEALEHAVDPHAAVRELLRVVKPGGSVLIIDKDLRCESTLECAPWERWLERGEVESWLRDGCDEVSCSAIEDPVLPEGMFLAWRGRLRETDPR